MYRLTPIFILAGLCAVAPAAVVDVIADKDNTLIEDSTGSVSNGGNEGIYSGLTGGTAPIPFRLRAVLHFNISAAVPSGSVITAATLVLNVVQSGAGSSTQNYSVHLLTADWGEGTTSGTGGAGAPAATGDATWLHRFFNTTSWTAQGGDFTGTPSATLAVGTIGAYSWSSAQLLADVQNWHGSPANNFGWIIIGDEATVQTARKFASREHLSSPKPKLTITYSPPAGVDEWMLY